MMRDHITERYDDCQISRQPDGGNSGRAEHAHPEGHSHAHGEAHDHGHGHAHASSTRRLAIAAIITAVFVVAEVVGGLLSNSVALLADAGHMLTDVGRRRIFFLLIL